MIVLEIDVAKIKMLCVKHKLTGAELARRAGISAGTIDRIFNGRIKQPWLGTIGKILAVFGVGLEEIVKE